MGECSEYNAVIGENGNEKYIGKYGLGQQNQRGEQLLNFGINSSLWIQIPCSKTTKEEFTHGKLWETVIDSKSTIFW